MNFEFLNNLAERFGTPLYSYDVGSVKESYQELVDALPDGSDIFFSLKSNPHPALAKTLMACGSKVEITSDGEMDVAFLAGFNTKDMLYAGPGKTTNSLIKAFERNIKKVAIESWDDLARVNDIAKRTGRTVDALLRINPDQQIKSLGMSMVGVSSQFGFEIEDLIGNLRLENYGSVNIKGFQIYYGSQIFDSTALLETAKIGIAASARVAKKLGIDVTYIDLGGGFGHPFAKRGAKADLIGLKAGITACLNSVFPPVGGQQVKLGFESGRFLVAGSGVLITRVEHVKESKGKTFVVLDAGINHLGGMSGLGRLPKLEVDLVSLQRDDTESTMVADIVGPLCTPLDCIARNRTIPKVKVGDLVALPNVGAYGLTASLNGFLSRPFPVEVISEGDKVIEVSRLNTIRNIL